MRPAGVPLMVTSNCTQNPPQKIVRFLIGCAADGGETHVDVGHGWMGAIDGEISGCWGVDRTLGDAPEEMMGVGRKGT
jgi:hypothetical protein